MSSQDKARTNASNQSVHLERTFTRFTLIERWQHTLLLLSFTTLILTGLPQRYRAASWSQQIITSPERLLTIRQVHHIAALVLTLLVIYHLGRALFLIFRRKLPGDMLPTWQDVKDATQMIKYLLFLTKEQPRFGKFNFEQKVTYWFLFFGILIMVISGFIIWFPLTFTRFLPGGIVPAAKLAHSTEAVAAGIFVVIWHFYHVHLQRLNLSIFTGKLSEQEMRTYHAAEFEHLTGEETNHPAAGDSR
jgi:formate dehydrogenase gamma subunit